MKNIPVTTEKYYLLKLIEEIEIFMERMGWGVIYRDVKGSSIKTNTWVKESEDTTSNR